MLHVQKVTRDVWHYYKKINIKKLCNMAFAKWKLVTSIFTNPTWNPRSLFCCRLVSAMFPFIVSCLQGPCQQDGYPLSLCLMQKHSVSCRSKWCNWHLIHTPCFIPTTKGNTISLGWPHLQRFTQDPAWYP